MPCLLVSYCFISLTELPQLGTFYETSLKISVIVDLHVGLYLCLKILEYTIFSCESEKRNPDTSLCRNTLVYIQVLEQAMIM